MIKEHDRIVLTERVPATGLEAGNVGTVVHVYADGKAFEVEFTTLNGRLPRLRRSRHSRFDRSPATRSRIARAAARQLIAPSRTVLQTVRLVSWAYRHPLEIQTGAKTFECAIPGSLEATTRFGIFTRFPLHALEQRPGEGRTDLTGQRQRRFQDLVGVAFHGSIELIETRRSTLEVRARSIGSDWQEFAR
jgi:hypothetical protein